MTLTKLLKYSKNQNLINYVALTLEIISLTEESGFSEHCEEILESLKTKYKRRHDPNVALRELRTLFGLFVSKDITLFDFQYFLTNAEELCKVPENSSEDIFITSSYSLIAGHLLSVMSTFVANCPLTEREAKLLNNFYNNRAISSSLSQLNCDESYRMFDHMLRELRV